MGGAGKLIAFYACVTRLSFSRKFRVLAGVVCGVFLLIMACLVLDLILDPVLVNFLDRREAQRSSAPKWRSFTNNECGYIIDFPNKPFENPIELENKDAVVSYRQFAASLGDGDAFMVATLVTSISTDITGNQIKSLLQTSTRGTVKEGDVLLAERDVTLGTNLGWEVEVKKADGKYFRMRAYQIRHDVQQIVVLVPMAERDSTNITRFMGSFRLISK